MYLATAGGVFYRFNMSLLPAQSGPATGPAVVIKTGNPSFQLSFSCDFSTLWAQQYDNNQWSTINTGEFFLGREGQKREEKNGDGVEILKKKKVGTSLDLDLFSTHFHTNSHGSLHPQVHPRYPRAGQGTARPRRSVLHLCLILKTLFLSLFDFHLLFPFRTTR